MELLQLHYFRTVARLEHMTKAAEELQIAQPALSKTISRLEADLGVRLFDRHNRQIRLNTFGKAFLKKVDAALTALDEGRREVADLAGLARGSIAIATNSLHRLAEVVGAFRAMYPEVDIRILQVPPAQGEEMNRLLEAGDVDLCFGASAMNRPGICEQVAWEAEVFLAVPSGHRLERESGIALTEAAGETFIEYKQGHPFRSDNEGFCRLAGIQRNVMYEVEDPESLKSLVIAGLGVAFMPVDKRRAKDPQFTLLPIKSPSCRRRYFVSWVDKRYVSQAAEQFKQFLVTYFRR
ncbi:LysR family transcriptional regulator [Paenibacillus sp. M1]|uniref:LysR family transcriptional regulator n=1 Tax=Paenibacillus haidiansis TaxID=1574488 RepID=A0ABU7VPU5_9BACL